MKRREFITLLGGAAAAWPLAARGSSRRCRSSGSSSATRPKRTQVRRRLPQGSANRPCRGPQCFDRIPLGGRRDHPTAGRWRPIWCAGRSAVIVAPGGVAAALAAKAATATIPIVFVDWRRSGQARPRRQPQSAGRQCTGITSINSGLGAKQLGLLRQLLRRMRASRCWSIPATRRAESARGRAGRGCGHGAASRHLTVTTNREIEPAFAIHAQRGPMHCSSAPIHFSAGGTNLPRWRRAVRYRRSITPARVRRRRRADQLRQRASPKFSPCRRLHRPYPQGREAGRPADRAGDQVRTRHQPHRPPRRSASTCRRRCSPSPTR